MAAQLTEEESKSTVQEFTRAEFERFVKACRNPPVPIKRLQELFRPNFAGGGLGYRRCKGERSVFRVPGCLATTVACGTGQEPGAVPSLPGQLDRVVDQLRCLRGLESLASNLHCLLFRCLTSVMIRCRRLPTGPAVNASGSLSEVFERHPPGQIKHSHADVATVRASGCFYAWQSDSKMRFLGSKSFGRPPAQNIWRARYLWASSMRFPPASAQMISGRRVSLLSVS